MLQLKLRIDSFERLLAIERADNNAFAQRPVKLGSSVGVVEHFLYGVGQRKIRILNRHEVQIAGAHIVSRVDGIHSPIGRNDVENKEVWLLHLVFVALNLGANAFALNGDPFFAADHAAKLLLDLVLIRYLPVDGAIVERQT